MNNSIDNILPALVTQINNTIALTHGVDKLESLLESADEAWVDHVTSKDHWLMSNPKTARMYHAQLDMYASLIGVIEASLDQEKNP